MQNINSASIPKLATVKPTEDLDSVTQWGYSEVRGNGLQILSGVDAFETRHAVQILLITIDESTGEEFTDRVIEGGEIRAGKMLLGHFNKIVCRWTKDATFASHAPPAIKFRVFQHPHRVGAVDVGFPHGQPTIDVAHGEATVSVLAGAWGGIYDDDISNRGVLTNNAGGMLQGQGIGGDFRIGRHWSPKRRLVCTANTTNTTNDHRLLVQGRINSGPYLPIWQQATTETIVGPASTTRVLTTGPEGILVPGDIQIWLFNNAGAGAAFSYWISFH